MRTKNLLLFWLSFAISVFVSTSTFASKEKSPLDTAKFMGIRLDNEFPGNVPQCPKAKVPNFPDREAVKSLPGPCFFPRPDGSFELLNGPDIGVGHVMVISTYQEKPLKIKMAFGNKRFDKVEEIFQIKYGRAHSAYTEPLLNARGDTFSSRVRGWEGSRLRIRIDEIGDDINWGAVVVENVTLHKVLEADRKASSKEAANKL